MMRVFIADDEEIIRDGIRNCIEKEQERFLFAGEAPASHGMDFPPGVLIQTIAAPQPLQADALIRRSPPRKAHVFRPGAPFHRRTSRSPA